MDWRMHSIVAYGTGLPGSGNISPKIGAGGDIPTVGSSTFNLELTDAIGGGPSLIAGSLERWEQELLGLRLYGDFLTPGGFTYGIVMTSGAVGVPGAGTATLPIPIPNDASLIGFTTYWQGFVLDSGSSSLIGLSHTGGLAATVVQ